jgi:hypothetical protein
MIPKLTRPEYTTTIPSTNKKIKYHPFTVREEKVLMLAAEGGDQDEIINAVTNCLQNCISSPSDIDIESLALFDIEYLFLKTRSKSVGEVINLRVIDPDDEDFSTDVEVNIDKIGVKKTEGHTQLIKVDDTVSVQMRYPDITFFNTGVDLSTVASTVSLVSRCIDQIIVGDEVYNKEDMTQEEITEWVEGLSQKQFTLFIEFFGSMPKMSHTITAKNTNTKKNFSVTLEGLADFF